MSANKACVYFRKKKERKHLPSSILVRSFIPRGHIQPYILEPRIHWVHSGCVLVQMSI